MAEIRRKLVIVGDGACGKTCLLMYVPNQPTKRPIHGLNLSAHETAIANAVLYSVFSKGTFPEVSTYHSPPRLASLSRVSLVAGPHPQRTHLCHPTPQRPY